MRRISAGVFVAGWATFVNFYTPQAILPDISAAFGATQASVGLAITVTLLAVSCVAPFAGAISDRLGRKSLIVAACAGVVVPTLLVAASSSLSMFLVWRFAQGLLLPFVFAVTVAYIADECPGPDAVRATGIYASGAIFGGFFGRFAAGVLTDVAGWRVAFVALAGLTVLAALFLAWVLPKERQFRPVSGGLGATLGAYRDHLGNARLLATCGVAFGMLFSQVATFTFINFVLTDAPYDLSPSQLGGMFAVYLVGMVTTPLAARASVHIGRRAALAGSIGTSACGLVLTLLPSLTAIVVGLTLICAGLFVVQALSTGFIGVAVKRARSSAVAVYVTIYYVGGAMGGVAPGWLWHHAGWPGVVGLLLAMLAAMLATATIAWRVPAAG